MMARCRRNILRRRPNSINRGGGSSGGNSGGSPGKLFDPSSPSPSSLVVASGSSSTSMDYRHHPQPHNTSRPCSSSSSSSEETIMAVATSSAAATMATIRSSPPNEELIRSRKHLSHVTVRQKNSILVYGLSPNPKCQGKESQSTQQQQNQAQQQSSTRNIASPTAMRHSSSSLVKSVHDLFSRYGKICKCVLDPKSLPLPPPPFAQIPSPVSDSLADSKRLETDCSNSTLKQKQLVDSTEEKNPLPLQTQKPPSTAVTNNNKTTMTAYITYSNEKGASNAIREADMSIFDGRRIRVTRAMTRYCDDFLQGLHCENLDCILLHEVVCNKDQHHHHNQNNQYHQNNNHQQRISSPARALENPAFRGSSDKRKNAWNTSPSRMVKTPGVSFVQKVLQRDVPTGTLNEKRLFKEKKRQMPDKEKALGSGCIGEINLQEANKARTITPSPTNAHDVNSYVQTSKVGNITPEYTNITNESASISSKSYSPTIDDVPSQSNPPSYKLDLPAARQLFTTTIKPKSCAVSPPRLDVPDPSTQTLNGYNNPWDIKSPIVITGRKSTPVKVRFDRMCPDWSERMKGESDSSTPLNLSPPRIKSRSRNEQVTDLIPMSSPPPIGGNEIFSKSKDGSLFGNDTQKNENSSNCTPSQSAPTNNALVNCMTPVEYSVDMGTLLRYAGVGKSPNSLTKQALLVSPAKSVGGISDIFSAVAEEKKDPEGMKWPYSQASYSHNAFLQHDSINRINYCHQQPLLTSIHQNQSHYLGRNDVASFLPYDCHSYYEQIYPQYHYHGQVNPAMNRIGGTYSRPFMPYSQHRPQNDLYLLHGGRGHQYPHSHYPYPRPDFVRR